MPSKKQRDPPADFPMSNKSYSWDGMCIKKGSLYYTSGTGAYRRIWLRNLRSLDGGEQEDRGGAIDSVARANSIPPEQTSHMLPEIRAAPCPIHFKRDMDKGHDLLFSTTSYVRDVKMFKRFQPHPIKHIPIYQRGSSQQTLRGNKLGVSVRVPRQYPVKPSTLPEPCRPKITSCPGLCTVLPHKDQTTFLILYKDH